MATKDKCLTHEVEDLVKSALLCGNLVGLEIHLGLLLGLREVFLALAFFLFLVVLLEILLLFFIVHVLLFFLSLLLELAQECLLLLDALLQEVGKALFLDVRKVFRLRAALAELRDQVRFSARTLLKANCDQLDE